MTEQDLTQQLQEQVQQALAERTPLRIVGGGSKTFYTPPTSASERLELAGHTGIVAYRPSESVVTVRTGTRLAEISAVLAEHKQMLAFEPPLFGETATIGGAFACGWSGPRRPFAGSARDFMLGCTLINGYGEVLRFGGQVMKNVAGFDVSRLMVGAQGSLGVLLEVSLRVLPRPEHERSMVYEANNAGQALAMMNRWAGQPWPLSALAYDGAAIHYRLSGAEAAVGIAEQKLGGQIEDGGFWHDLREQRLAFFAGDEPLWRISVAPATAPLDLPENWLLDWCGALRWLKSHAPSREIHQAAQQAGGHAHGFRNVNPAERLRLAPEILALQARIKHAFDPEGIFNPPLNHDQA